LTRDTARECRIGLIGLADDLGVRLNNGRPGAKGGPAAFRAALAKYGVADPQRWDWPRVFDAGDIVPAAGEGEAALHETHRRVTEAVRAILELGLVPVGIGGGHDLTFPFVRAVAEDAIRRGQGSLSGVYLDAHLDVRPTVGSGMPFRRLVEECGVHRLEVYGLNEFANSREHAAWFQEHGGTIHFGEMACPGLGIFPGGDLFFSTDLDVAAAAVAPGVSATNPGGWSAATMEAWARAAGRCAGVRCFDIMELNPAFDVDGRTARLAAHLFLSFLRGFAERGS
jgi:formimidoylglutamase